MESGGQSLGLARHLHSMESQQPSFLLFTAWSLPSLTLRIQYGRICSLGSRTEEGIKRQKESVSHFKKYSHALHIKVHLILKVPPEMKTTAVVTVQKGADWGTGINGTSLVSGTNRIGTYLSESRACVLKYYVVLTNSLTSLDKYFLTCKIKKIV